MIAFSYDDINKCCKVNVIDEYSHLYDINGIDFNMNTMKGSFQLCNKTVNVLMERYAPKEQKIEWKLSFMEHMQEFLKRKTTQTTTAQLLQSYTMEKALNLPALFNYGNNPPQFVNQKIGQYWHNYTQAHALLWEMGTGKTRATVEGFEIKRKKGLVSHGLVVCPVSMIDKWVIEIELWSGEKSAIGIKGGREEKETIIGENWVWYVVSFETITNLLPRFLEVIDEKWFVCLDEFTKIKNPNAKRAKACVEVGKKTEHKDILSGTPVTQHAYDLFTPYLFLDGGRTFGMKYDDFIEKYFWKQGYRKIAKRDALQEIGKLMYNNATRFLKKDCIDIPDKVYDQRYLALPGKNQKSYDEMVKFCLTQIEGSEKVTAFVILTQLLRLSQITSGFVKDAMGRECGFEENPKLAALEEILEESNGTSVIVWSRFIWDTRAIAGLCEKMEIPYTTLTGETKPDERTRNIADFQSGARKVIIGTAGTGGHGIDLVKASLVVYYSNSYSLEQRLQSEDRAHRAGQKNQVTYIDLLCKNTIDVSIYKILRNKKNIADIVTGDNVRNMMI